MTKNFVLRACKLIVQMFTLSIRIVPAVGSTSQNSATHTEDSSAGNKTWNDDLNSYLQWILPTVGGGLHWQTSD